jgi:DNA polymerase (family 10)
MADLTNRDVADRLEEAAHLLREQGSDRYRVEAYRRAAAIVRQWPVPTERVFRERGLDGLDDLPGIGPTIARAIRELLMRGRLPMLERLRGAADPVTLLASVPGIGPRLGTRLHDELQIDTLEQLEAAAHDGRLAAIGGFGRKRLAGIRDSLAHRLGRIRAGQVPAVAAAPVAELLDVDREYREKARAGQLRMIAPRRFNAAGRAWLPVLHTVRGARHYTALFSNSARAHRLGKTLDWVVIYGEDAIGEQQHTVITALRGPLRGQRVVAGREDEPARLTTGTAA